MQNPLHYHLPSFPKKLSTEAPLFTQMAKKADAWKEYEEAALVDMMLKVVIVHRGKSLPFSQKSHKTKTLLNFPGSSSSCSGGKRPADADGQDHDGQLRRWPRWGEQAHRRGGRNRRDFYYFCFSRLFLAWMSYIIDFIFMYQRPEGREKEIVRGSQ